MPVTNEKAAAVFSALGNPARLDVLRWLVRAGCAGLNVGQLQAKLNIPPSTLAHHLSALARAGAIIQKKRGREVINLPDFSLLNETATYLMAECCADMSDQTQSEQELADVTS